VVYLPSVRLCVKSEHIVREILIFTIAYYVVPLAIVGTLLAFLLSFFLGWVIVKIYHAYLALQEKMH